MQSVQIVADRFLVDADGRAIDLVNGAPVVLRIGVGGGAAEQRRWAARCDVLFRVTHRFVAPLIDYGGLGESQRFEAWRCGEPFEGPSDHVAHAVDAASRFLVACGLTAGTLSKADVHVLERSPVVVPVAEAGYALDGDAGAAAGRGRDTWSSREFGICSIHRRADSILEDVLLTASGSRPHIVSVAGPPGSGRTSAGFRAARVARLNGFVPVGLSMAERLPPGWLDGRQLCLLSDDDERPWRGLLNAALVSARPHVVMRFGRCDRGGALAGEALQRIDLEPVAADALVAAVRPRVRGAALDRVKRAAVGARGWPGRFAALLSNPDARVHLRVAEQPAVYGSGPWSAAETTAGLSVAWPAPGDLAALRRRVDAAAALLGKGRHAPAVRQLRQALGALSRRREWTDASAAALTLASALLRRGDTRGAVAALSEGRVCAKQTGSDAPLIDTAVLSGHALIDLVRLDEAESVIGTALAVARRIGDAPRASAASLALARCLFWKGRYADAASALARPRENTPTDFLVRLLVASARVAIGQGNLPNAVTLAREAADRASNSGEPSLVARASCAAAFAHLAAGDLDAVRQDVCTSVRASRSAHDPMLAIRARILLAESERRRGHLPTSFVARLRRIAPLRLPPLLLARTDLLQALMQARDTDEPAIVARHVGRLGLPALSLFAQPSASGSAHPDSWGEAATDGLVGILSLCQTAEDETAILGKVCSRVRHQLHAAAVALFVREGTGVALVASDGARIDAAIAARAMAADLPLAPHRLDDRLEAAASIRYGGESIAALVARWPLGTPYDLSRAAAVLTMASAASAPVVSAAMARRSRPVAPALTDLLGVTPGMSDLRRAIDRAAAAPFTVLVEGESGSGKELVAKAIHRTSLRRDRPFCTLNCAALPDDLVEAELFGHARGAFTGAIHERIGVFEEAHGGTLLLDEVGELSPRAQAKLLRVIQEGELRRIGENSSRRVDVRIVAATNRDLRREVAEGRFRLDLLYRLDVVRLVVPPLRDRREDIGMLADSFWREATGRVGSRAVLAAATVAALAQYDWPGNVRELQNVLAALAVRTPRRGVVTPAALPPQFGESRMADACRLNDARRTFEERFVRAALVRCGGHRTRAAAELGVTRQGLTKLLLRLGIEGQ